LSVEDVTYTPVGGADRQVPACALDAERVRAGAEPDARQVMVGTQRVPYWQGGPAYRPYAAGYFGGFGPMDWIFMGFAFNMMGDGLGGLAPASATGWATWPAGSVTASATWPAASATSSTASTSDVGRAGARSVVCPRCSPG
jgi:hypothetical protein